MGKVAAAVVKVVVKVVAVAAVGIGREVTGWAPHLADKVAVVRVVVVVVVAIGREGKHYRSSSKAKEDGVAARVAIKS